MAGELEAFYTLDTRDVERGLTRVERLSGQHARQQGRFAEDIQRSYRRSFLGVSNIGRASMFGITAATALAVKATRDYAKVNDDVAGSMARLDIASARAWRTFTRGAAEGGAAVADGILTPMSSWINREYPKWINVVSDRLKFPDAKDLMRGFARGPSGIGDLVGSFFSRNSMRPGNAAGVDAGRAKQEAQKLDDFRRLNFEHEKMRLDAEREDARGNAKEAMILRERLNNSRERIRLGERVKRGEIDSSQERILSDLLTSVSQARQNSIGGASITSGFGAVLRSRTFLSAAPSLTASGVVASPSGRTPSAADVSGWKFGPKLKELLEGEGARRASDSEFRRMWDKRNAAQEKADKAAEQSLYEQKMHTRLLQKIEGKVGGPATYSR